MRDVIIASANNHSAERIKTILQSGGVFVRSLLCSGNEVLAFTGVYPRALVVCGRLGDMTALTLANMLPQGCDVIHLLPSGESQAVFVSNMVEINMPLDRVEFLKTVKVMAATENEVLSRHKKSDETEEILDRAKRIIMNRHHVSEREAHKILQRRSMESGMKLLELARMIGDE